MIFQDLTLFLFHDLTKNRKERNEMPMWLEEGLCLILQADINIDLKKNIENVFAK